MKLKRIRNLREDNDYTQEYVAQYLDISQRVFAYYESGQHIIPIEILIQIADLYEVSLDYLCNRTNDNQ